MKLTVLFIYPQFSDGQREVIALFPDLYHDEARYGTRLITCYGTDGASSADRALCDQPRATMWEYAGLAERLENIGYELKVLNEGQQTKETSC